MIVLQVVRVDGELISETRTGTSNYISGLLKQDPEFAESVEATPHFTNVR